MSDERKCVCGHAGFEHAGKTRLGNECLGDNLRCSCKYFTPPTPDPRERGVNYAAMMAARDENERDAARVVDAYLADRGVRWSPGAAQMAADLLALEALRAPAPSEAVRKFSAAHTRAMSELEFTHGVGVRGDAPSEAVPEDERCEVCVERRATIHLEGAVNELCAECHIERLERVVNGPVGETRRLLASFIQRVGDNCRLDADGYCQGHFLERGDECTVKRARDLLATHPAPARGVTVTEEMVEAGARALYDVPASAAPWASPFVRAHSWDSLEHRSGPDVRPSFREAARAILTAALTPDAEGGA